MNALIGAEANGQRATTGDERRPWMSDCHSNEEAQGNCKTTD
jgi:hypothetical protein